VGLPVTASKSQSAITRVCALCGQPLVGQRPHARFCSNACKVEAGRLRAILSASNSEPYASVAERLEAAQKASKRPIATQEQSSQASYPRPNQQTAIDRLLSAILGRRRLRVLKPKHATANGQLSLFV
jgi:hypothetical protein